MNSVGPVAPKSVVDVRNVNSVARPLPPNSRRSFLNESVAVCAEVKRTELS
jgi:hypothetical protein